MRQPGTAVVLVMFTAYFDDSGTDGTCDTAVAACYVSSKRGWDDFVDAWEQAGREEGFDTFHMADFVAPREQGKKPWCDWSDEKKTRVYNRLARIINDNKRTGIAVAVPKAAYDRTPERIRRHYGRQHYTFAVRMCMTAIVKWRRRSGITLPLRYVFDWEMQRTPKREEIQGILDRISGQQDQRVAELLGLEPQGYGFEHKQEFKPLQAADILAWQMRRHMRKIAPLGHDDEKLYHPWFRMLREDQASDDCGFFTEEQIDKFVAETANIPLPPIYY